MAQITDVMDALAVFDAAHQELSWAYSGDFNDIPENLKSQAHKISEVLAEAGTKCVGRFMFSHDNTDEEGDTRSTSEAESQSIRGMDWLMRLKKVAYDMRAVARQELLEDCKIDDKPVRAWWLRCLPRARITRCNPTIDIVAENLEELRKQCVDFGYTATGLPLDTKQPFDGGQEETPVTTDVLVGRDDDKVVRNNDDKRSVSPQEWPGLRENPDIWNNNNFDSLVHRIMRRVCFWMESRPSLDAWFSFPYCAFVFPKRKGHGTHDLLNQWCSLGITTRQRGESCILELLGNWLLLLKKPASNASSMSDADGSNIKAGGALGLPTGEQSTIAKGQIGKEVRGEGERKEEVDEEEDTFLPLDESSFNENMGGNRIKISISSIPDADVTMEDFTHDFARYLLGDRLIIVDGRNGATPQLSCVNKSAYLALVSNLNAEQSEISSILPPKILALRFEDCREMELSDGAFAFAKYLRLLDLSGCSVKKLTGSIRHLKQLRYLKAPGIQDEVFPRPITGLHELRYLNLQGSCPLSDLTEAFMRFGNLIHLDLSGCSGLKELPKSFGRLWMLEHLDLSRSGIETLPDSFGWLKSLTHLLLAGCSGLKALPESFKSLPRLWHLNLSGCSGLKGLEELYSSSLPRELRHLDLSGCWGLKKLSTSSPPEKLQHLDLSGCSRLKAVVSYMPLIELQHLDLSGCSGLEEVGAGMLRPKLRHLDLSGCSVLKPSIAFDLERLMELMFLDMGCLRLQVPEDLVLAIRGRGGKASGPNDAKLVIDPEITVMNKLRGHFPEFNQPWFCS